MNKFKVGDRVRLIPVNGYQCNGIYGGTYGTIEHRHYDPVVIDDVCYMVRWDYSLSGNRHIPFRQASLELIPQEQHPMNTLNITKEKVLEAASKCSTAKATLQVLFPEAFEPEKVKVTTVIPNTNNDGCSDSPVSVATDNFNNGTYGGSLLIRPGFTYKETKTDTGYTVLTFYKK